MEAERLLITIKLSSKGYKIGIKKFQKIFEQIPGILGKKFGQIELGNYMANPIEFDSIFKKHSISYMQPSVNEHGVKYINGRSFTKGNVVIGFFNIYILRTEIGTEITPYPENGLLKELLTEIRTYLQKYSQYFTEVTFHVDMQIRDNYTE